MENQRVRLTKELLKQALISLLEVKKIEDIPIKELTSVAGINRSTFYLHYKNQQELLTELENDLLNSTVEHLANISASYTSIEIIEVFLEYIKKNKDITKVLLANNENKEFQMKMINLLLNLIQKQVPFKLKSDIAVYVYQFLLMGSFSIITTWINLDFNIPPKELAALIFDLTESSTETFN